ncbi:hypothetical protein M0P48_00365 [Candidatus Gracilibacteria bacterium]|nr:hypothetical protein [Candidatus Gracilibacteria bacterium]
MENLTDSTQPSTQPPVQQVQPLIPQPTPENQSQKTIIKISIAVLAVILIAVGGFFLYQKFFNTAQAHFLPPEFDKYAVGADASAFIIIRNDENTTNFIKTLGLPIQDKVSSFKNALLVSKNSNQKESIQATLQFTSPEAADDMKNFIESQSNPLLEDTDIVSKDGFLILSQKTAGDFEGSFYDNPNLAKLNGDIFDNQFLFYFDVKENASLLNIIGVSVGMAYLQPSVPSGIFPVASASGFINAEDNPSMIIEPANEISMQSKLMYMASLAKNNIFYIKIDDKTLSVGMATNIMSKDEFMALDSSIMPGTPSDKGSYYTEIIKSFDETIPELKSIINQLLATQEILSSKFDVSFKETIFDLKLEMSLSDLQELIKGLQGSLSEAPKKGRDTARIADVQRIEMALVSSNLEGNPYPANSQCVEKITEISESFSEEIGIPSDQSGPQSFGSITCEKGYYYQAIPKVGFLLWAKLEVPDNGNFDKTPDQVNTAKDISLGQSGNFYVVFLRDDSVGSSSSTTPITSEVKKVKR